MNTQVAPPDQLYHRLARRIMEHGGRVYVFVAQDIEAMPVTYAVNVAMLLASECGKCLLVDLDQTRNAVGRAFEIQRSRHEKPKACRTVIDGLFVWPGSHFARIRGLSVRKLLANATTLFDYVVINAPAIIERDDCSDLLLAADAAVIFGEQQGDFNSPLTEAAASAGCSIILP